MSDIGLTWDSQRGTADFSITENDLTADDGIESAVVLSLFTDRRAEDGDVLPDSEPTRRGWWGDTRPLVEGDRHGSRLWLLGRSKETQDVLRRAKDYAAEALSWLVEDKVADRVDVESVIVTKGVLGLLVRIYRPGATSPTQFRFNYTWAAQQARRG